jgi:hypothetical protein
MPHVDSFHQTGKAWLFLTDVDEDTGPLTYVPGSHRLTAERLAWQRRMSVMARASSDRPTREGSFRIDPADFAPLGLGKARSFAVPANTLVVADTFGFHARGPSTRPSLRVEIYFECRRSPFLPWTIFDPWSAVAIGWRTKRLWQLRDLLEACGLQKNKWRARTRRDVSLFELPVAGLNSEREALARAPVLAGEQR